MASIPPALPEFLNALEDYSPTIPDELTTNILERNGYPCQDKRLIRLISVAAQCFVANVANDTLQVCKRRKRMQQKKQRDEGYNPKDKRMVLTAEELAEVLQEYGVNLKVPPYFAEPKGQAK